MAKKYTDPPMNTNPGPGVYKKKSGISAQGSTFAKSSRDNALINKEQLKTPAPGEYGAKSTIAK